MSTSLGISLDVDDEGKKCVIFTILDGEDVTNLQLNMNSVKDLTEVLNKIIKLYGVD